MEVSVKINNNPLASDKKRESTKEKILHTSIKLFSQAGYKEVSTRAIAKEVGINSASIYFHFNSKKEILDAIYEYYDKQWNEAQPDIDELLKLAETDPPCDVLMKVFSGWKTPELQEIITRIYTIATRDAMIHPESMTLVRDMVMDRVKHIPRLLLERLIELGRIEPIDVEAFVTILSHISHSATSLNLTPLRMLAEDWHRCCNMLLSVIKPTGK
jgi:AcrR family transcriptional regulator